MKVGMYDDVPNLFLQIEELKIVPRNVKYEPPMLNLRKIIKL